MNKNRINNLAKVLFSDILSYLHFYKTSIFLTDIYTFSKYYSDEKNELWTSLYFAVLDISSHDHSKISKFERKKTTLRPGM